MGKPSNKELVDYQRRWDGFLVCAKCGALAPLNGVEKHNKWHQSMENVHRYVEYIQRRHDHYYLGT